MGNFIFGLIVGVAIVVFIWKGKDIINWIKSWGSNPNLKK